MWDVAGGLTRLCLGFDAKHGDRCRFRQEFPDAGGLGQNVVMPVHGIMVYDGVLEARLFSVPDPLLPARAERWG